MEHTICPYCHSNIKKSSRFCQVCGKELVSLDNDSEELVCPQCKTVNKPGSFFCKHCSVKLQQKPKKDPFIGLKKEFDDFINGEIEALQSNNLPLFNFMQYTEEKSKSILSQVEQMRKAIISSSQSSFSPQCISHIEKIVDNCRKTFWTICDKKVELLNEESEKSSPVDSSLTLYIPIGKAEAEFDVFGRTFLISNTVNIDILFKNNLIVRYNSHTEDTGADIVSTIIGRYLKAYQGKNINISIIDTLNFWGLGSAFNSLNENIYHLICDEYAALQELERIARYEQNIIHNKLSQQTPTAIDYNHSHNNLIPAKILIIRNFPQDIKSNFEVLHRIMRNSARSGICVILMFNEDEMSVMPKLKSSRDFSLDKWRNDAEYFDLINGAYDFLPKGTRFVPENLDEAELDWIVDEVNTFIYDNPSPVSVDVRDYLPDLNRAVTPRMNLSLIVGTEKESFAPQTLILNDMTIGNSLLVKGTEDSVAPIYNWMKAIALYALSRYSPDSLELMFCDFSNSEYFADFAGRLKNVRVIPKPRVKMITSEKTKGNMLVFITGINTLDEKELRILENAPKVIKRGIYLIVEDIFGVITSWSGQKLVFGPAALQSGSSISEQEFVLSKNGLKFVCNRFKTDDSTIQETLVSILKQHPSLLSSIVTDSENTEEKEDMTSLVVKESIENFEQTVIVSEETETVDNNIQYEDGPLYLTKYLPQKDKRWTYSSSEGLDIPIGVNPWKDDKTVCLRFSQTLGQNVTFLIGKPGTGKSSLLHTIILNAAYKYSPTSLNLYLVDLSGVEFQCYATYRLPHAKLVAPQAEREFALYILDEVEKEAKRREELFSSEGKKDFSNVSDLPRILLIIDEFQTLFDFDDDISSRAKEVIDHIVKKYRKFGINMLLATQKLPGTSKLDYSMINNRVVFDCSQDDFTTLFGAMNRLPAMGKGECLYTCNGKLNAKAHENDVKSYFIDIDMVSDDGTKLISSLIDNLSLIHPGLTYPPPKVFVKDREIAFGVERIRDKVEQDEFPDEMNLYLGEPVAPGAEVRATFDGSAFDNLLVLGGLREVAQGIAINALLSVGDAYTDGSATCYIISFMKKKAVLSNSASSFLCGIPFSSDSREIPRSEFVAFIKGIRNTVEERQKDFTGENHHIYLLFLEYQNSGIDSDVKKSLEFILKNGPQCGVFTIMQAGVLGPLKDRGSDINCYNHRVALQMSKEDSRDLIGSNKASSLNDFTKEKEKGPGLQRAYYFNKSDSILAKFIPYSYKPLIIDQQ